MTPILLAVMLFFLVLWWDINDDYKKWKNNISVKHGKEALIRILLLIPSIILLNFTLPIDIVKILLTIALEAFTYLLLFDGIYNIKRRQNWWFLGTVDKDDALWDKIQRKIPLWLLKILKIGIPIGLLYMYINN